MQEVNATIDCINTLCMDVIRVQAEKECKDGNDCQWLQCAVQVLTNNLVNVIGLAEALRDLMRNGWGKNRDIFRASPASYGEKFLISTL